MEKKAHSIFVTGGTGYIGQRLIPALLERGHRIRALVRSGSEHKLKGCGNGNGVIFSRYNLNFA